MFPADLLPATHHSLTQKVLSCYPAKAIFLLGTITTQKRTSSVFNDTQPSCIYISHFYLLLLVDTNEESDHTNIQDKVENNLRHCFPVTSIILNTERFNIWLMQGHPFASVVLRKASLLHNECSFNEPARVDEEVLLKKRRSVYDKGVNAVNEFLAGAELYIRRKQNAMAAFMLHQATEHGLRAILKLTTGLHINTHNLDKLLRYSSLATYKITEIFHPEMPAGKTLFNKLQSAYIDARYKEYSITGEELLKITAKIKELRSILRQYSGPCNL